MTIPKIIHQVWEGRTEPNMPIRLQILARTWKKWNPDWEYHLWNGEEMDELVFTHYPEYLSMYKSFPNNVQRWDTIRYMLLHKYGGVYTDLDTECFRPIDTLFENKDMCFGEEPPEQNILWQGGKLVGNAFMASQKGNAGWMDVLSEISLAMQRDYPSHPVLNTTGPFMISRIFDSLREKYKACSLPFQEVTPVTKYIMSQYIFQGQKELFNEKIRGAYCAHYFFGSWDKIFSFY